MLILINIITLSRIFLGLLIYLLISTNSSYWLAVFLFFFASISDFFDGYLARKYNQVSSLGEILDPIADKILIVFALFAISINLDSFFIGLMSSIIITREIWVGALRDYNARHDRSSATKVLFIAKVKTTAQMFSISLYLIGLALNLNLIILVADISLFGATMVTIYTGFLYTYNTFYSQK